ncbi:hypothetical protein BDZ89DRAFT_1076774, partial [Hymenopellis radicata]
IDIPLHLAVINFFLSNANSEVDSIIAPTAAIAMQTESLRRHLVTGSNAENMGFLLNTTLGMLKDSLYSLHHDLRGSGLERENAGRTTAICFRVIGGLIALKTDLTANNISSIRSRSLSICRRLFTSPSSHLLFNRENADVWCDTTFLTLLAQTWRSHTQSDWLDPFGPFRDFLTVTILVFTRSLRTRVPNAYQDFGELDVFHLVREFPYSLNDLGMDGMVIEYLSGSTSTNADDLGLPYILQKDNLLTICMIISLSTPTGSTGNLDVLQRVMQMSPNHESWTYCRNSLREFRDRYKHDRLPAQDHWWWYDWWIYHNKMASDVVATLVQITIERLDKYFVGAGYRQEGRRPTPAQMYVAMTNLRLNPRLNLRSNVWPWAQFRVEAPVVVSATYETSNQTSSDEANERGLELVPWGTTSNG